LNKKGTKAVGVCGLDSNFAALELMARDEYIPVASTYTDTEAAGVAASLIAEKLIFITDVAGVKIPEGNSEHIKVLTSEQAEKLIKDEIISEGMVSKVRGCLLAIDAGVRRTHIINGLIPHCIIMEMFTHKGIGTMILKEIIPYFEAEEI